MIASALRTVAPFTVLALAVHALPAQAAGGWTVAEASGAVDAGGSAVRAGAAITDGAMVATGRMGRAVLTRGGNRVTLNPGSRIAIAADALRAERGSAAVVATGPLAVATPYLVARAEHSTFSVTVNGGGATILVREGAADVATVDGGAVRRISAGAVAMVSADARDSLFLDGAMRGLVRSAASAPAVATAEGNAVSIAFAR